MTLADLTTQVATHPTEANREALADALAAEALRERYAMHNGDPWRELGLVHSPFFDAWEAADEWCADKLAQALARAEGAA